MLVRLFRAKTRHAPKKRRALRLESLECRRLLAASPWTNPLEPLDTNGDGTVTARDALVTINQISRASGETAGIVSPPILGATGAAPPYHFDTSGDRRITALDALRVINHLGRAGEGGGEQVNEASPPPAEVAKLTFEEDFARTSGVLSSATERDTFEFIAHRSHVAIDLSSLSKESIAEIRVLDEFGRQITKASELRERAAFEGIKLPVTQGRKHQIVVERAAPEVSIQPEPYAYVLDVFQFETDQWRGATISNVNGYEWIDHFGPDSEMGDDLHGNESARATLVRPFNKKISFLSHLDSDQDVDWFRIPVNSNAVRLSVHRSQGTRIKFDVFDAQLDPLEPVTSLSREGIMESGTFVVGPMREVYVRVRGNDAAAGTYSFNLEAVGVTPP
ncbi:MAG: dockerin type I domain-containing protein [Pirellulales bacterium]|nr:dockerin type I domain-containing protein [Pirellulales bacterium]